MQFALAENHEESKQLCRKFHVRRLELFGSALGSNFNPVASDFDFLVEFEPLTPEAYSAAFFGLKDALGSITGRSVDLVVPSAIRNPYFRQSVGQKKALLYAA